MTLSTQNNGGATELSKDKSSSYTDMVFSATSKVHKKMADAGSAVISKVEPDSRKEVVQKLDKVLAEVSAFLYRLENTKQEQHRGLQKTRETGSLPRKDLIGRGNDKEFAMQWLRKPSNEHPGTDLYRNISFLSIVGHGGMGKTYLLQHIYEDEMTKEFDFKMSMKNARRMFDGLPGRNVVDKLLERLKVVPSDDFQSMEAQISLGVAGIANAVVAALTASVIFSDPHRVNVSFMRNNSD